MTEAAPGVAALPAHGTFLIRGGYLMTMDRELGDIPAGDVHVSEGAIVAVGPGAGAVGAEVIDARRMIVLPGLVGTHWHMWNSLLRCMSGEDPRYGYFRTCARPARRSSPATFTGHPAGLRRGDLLRRHLCT